MSVTKPYNMYRATDNRGTYALSPRQHLLFAALLISLMFGCVSHIRHLDVHLMHNSPIHRYTLRPNSWDVSVAESKPLTAAGGAAQVATAAPVKLSSVQVIAVGSTRDNTAAPASPNSSQQPPSSKEALKPPGSKPTVPPLQSTEYDRGGLHAPEQNSTSGVVVKPTVSTVVNKMPGVPAFMYRYVEGVSQPPLQLKYPLWWFGPFWSGSGYGSEAATYMLSMLRSGRVMPQGLWLAHHGDDAKESVIKTMTTSDREELAAMEKMPKLANRPVGTVVVCHSMPTNWPWPKSLGTPGAICPPEPGMTGWQYVVGRTMFETDKLPKEFVPRVNALQEVWVPSDWGRTSFIASGVDPRKVRVVPEGINTTQYDPALYTPLDMAARSELVLGRHWTEKVAQTQLHQLKMQQNVTKQEPHREVSTSAATTAPPAAAATSAAGSKRRPFVFFSCGKWERRKGWEVLLEAYLAEFTAADDVELYIMTKPFGGSGSGFQDKMQVWVRNYVRRTRLTAKRSHARSMLTLPQGATGCLQGGANIQLDRAAGTLTHLSSSEYFWNVLFNTEVPTSSCATQPAQQPSSSGNANRFKGAVGTAMGQWVISPWQPMTGMQDWVRQYVMQPAQQQLIHHWAAMAAQVRWLTAGARVGVMQQQKGLTEAAAAPTAGHHHHQQRQQQQVRSTFLVGRPAEYKGSSRALLTDDTGSSQATSTSRHDVMGDDLQRQPQQSGLNTDESTSAADSGVDEEWEVGTPEDEDVEPADEQLATLYVLHEHVSDEDFPRLYKSSDVFVLASRGEGWGRPHVEAMSMGLPVIATNWSGSTAFLDETVGYPLPIDGVLPVEMRPDTENSWFKGLKWAQPSVGELQRIMRAVYNDRHTAKVKGAAARRRMVERYSPQVIAEVVLKELLRIQQKMTH